MNKEKIRADHAHLAAPVGFFDSGVGGLSVLQAARRLLPHENMLYFADSAHCPYGSKSADFVRQRSLAISRFLLDRGAKAVVVACNSASEAALEFLRQILPRAGDRRHRTGCQGGAALEPQQEDRRPGNGP